MKKGRKKKKNQLKNGRDYSIFRDKSSLTIPILANTLSTSISIIDIDIFHYINGVGCQNNSEALNHKEKQKTKMYHDKDNTSPSVNPKNTRLFQSRRIQVGDNVFSKGDFYSQTKQQRSSIVQYKDYVEILKQYEANEVKQHDNLKLKNCGIKVSYPDVNIHVLSMMLPKLNESMVSTKKEQFERTKSIILTTDVSQNENHEYSGKNEVYTKHEEYVKQKEFSMNIQHKKVQMEKTDLINRKISDTSRELEILWKYVLHPNYEQPQNFFNRISKGLKYTSGEKSIGFTKQQQFLSATERHKRDDEKNYEQIEQLYFNDKVQETESGKENVGNQIEVMMQINKNTSKEENWIPKLVRKVHNCFSYIKEFLVEGKKNSSENNIDFKYRNRKKSHPKIFSKEDDYKSSKNKDLVTLFYKENNTSSSSTNFIPQLTNITMNNPELTLKNPYCRNYFVYFNKYAPTSSLPVANFQITKEYSRYETYFTKQKCLLNQQYSCFEDIAKVILFLTKMLAEETIYPTTKCFTSVFRIRDIFRKVASISCPSHKNCRKLEMMPELIYSLNSTEIIREILKVNHSLPVCWRPNTRKKRTHVVTDVDVTIISEDSVLVRWKVPKILLMLTKGYKIFLNNVFQCTLMSFETCAVLDNVDMSKPMLITIMTYTADGYCCCTKVKTYYHKSILF